MSRSTVSPPPGRGGPSEGRPRRERSDERERQAKRPQRVSASFASARTRRPRACRERCARGPLPDQPSLKPFGGAFQC
jgi:hypothetical protein